MRIRSRFGVVQSVSAGRPFTAAARRICSSKPDSGHADAVVTARLDGSKSTRKGQCKHAPTLRNLRCRARLVGIAGAGPRCRLQCDLPRDRSAAARPLHVRTEQQTLDRLDRLNLIIAQSRPPRSSAKFLGAVERPRRKATSLAWETGVTRASRKARANRNATCVRGARIAAHCSSRLGGYKSNRPIGLLHLERVLALGDG